MRGNRWVRLVVGGLLALAFLVLLLLSLDQLSEAHP